MAFSVPHRRLADDFARIFHQGRGLGDHVDRNFAEIERQLRFPIIRETTVTSGDVASIPTSGTVMASVEIPARPGDFVVVHASSEWYDTNANRGRLAPFSYVDGAQVRQLAGGSAGVVAWRGSISAETPFGGHAHTTVAAGDLKDEKLDLRLVAWSSSTTKSMRASTDFPFQVLVINYGSIT